MTPIFEHLIARYHEFSYTNQYIYGFFFQNMVYMVRVDASIMPYILKLDKASRGAGYSLRFCPTKAQKILLLSKGATILCSKVFFDEAVRTSKYNRGEIFEKMVVEYFGLEWKKDTVPFYEGADATIDGVDYQIKFERATFTNEKILAGIP